MAETRQSRRRERGAASARSLLLTVLGEFVLPHGTAVWTGGLVDALAEVGVEEKAARQALARTAAEGLLTAQRSGRRSAWTLTGAGERLLEEGTRRIYGFEREQHSWDGRWLVLAVTVPDGSRQTRHRLRTRLAWAGLGSPMPGIWVTPDAAKEDEALEVVKDLAVEAFSWVGPAGAIGDEQQIVAQAWRLDEIAARYRDFLDAVRDDVVDRPADAFPAQVHLVQEWRRFPFLDPALPVDLLPAGWPGTEAAELFHQRHDTWHAAAQAHWDDLCRAAAGRA